MNYKIEFTDTLSEDTEEKMRKDLVEYECSHGIDVNYKKFALVLKDESENVLGVLNAFTAFSEIYVDDMWVDSSCRGKGYGRKLLQELENHFEGKGFNNINLVTSTFNAPANYNSKYMILLSVPGRIRTADLPLRRGPRYPLCHRDNWKKCE